MIWETKLVAQKCWFCGRLYGIDRALINKVNPIIWHTKDHIMPTSRGGINHPLNYVSCCADCNGLKANRTIFEFILYLQELIWKNGHTHRMKDYLKRILFKAWKLYNKRDKKLYYLLPYNPELKRLKK